MTVITYLSTAGKLPKEIQVLEHPSASRNAPEPLFEIEEPRTMWDPSDSPIPGFCGVSGRSTTKGKDDLKVGGGVKRGNWQRKKQTWGRGDGTERMKKGGREDLCNLEKKVIRNYSKGNGQSRREGEDKSRTDVSGILLGAETKGEINQWAMRKGKRWPVFLWRTEEKVKKISMAIRRYHVFLWLTVLLSQCLQPASAQVGVAVKSRL